MYSHNNHTVRLHSTRFNYYPVGCTRNVQHVNMQLHVQCAYEPCAVRVRWQVAQAPFSRHLSSSTQSFRLLVKNWKYLFYFRVTNSLLFNTRCDGVPSRLQHLLLTYARRHAHTPDGHEDARKLLYKRLYFILWVCATSTVIGRETIIF